MIDIPKDAEVTYLLLRSCTTSEVTLFLEQGMLAWLTEAAHSAKSQNFAESVDAQRKQPISELAVLMANMMEANNYGIQPKNQCVAP